MGKVADRTFLYSNLVGFIKQRIMSFIYDIPG